MAAKYGTPFQETELLLAASRTCDDQDYASEVMADMSENELRRLRDDCRRLEAWILNEIGDREGDVRDGASWSPALGWRGR